MFNPPTSTHAECRYQRPAVSGRRGFAMRCALRNGSSIPRTLPDCLIRLTSRLRFAKDIVLEKFVAVRRKFVYKTQFNRCCRSLAVLRGPDLAKAFHFYRFRVELDGLWGVGRPCPAPKGALILKVLR